MDVHRHWKVHLRGPGLLALAVVLFFSPQLLALIGYQFRLGDWVGYVLGAIALLAGIVLLLDGLRAYALRINAEGVTWTKGRQTTRFEWTDITRVTFEKKAGDPTLLTVWTPDSVTYDVTPDQKRDGLHGYRVADTTEIVESTDQIRAALREYAGDRFVPAAS